MSLDTIFVGTESDGVFNVSISTGDLGRVTASGPECLTLMFANAWNSLFVSTSEAIYTLRFDSSTMQLQSVEHEWIGGNIDFPTSDMAFCSDDMWFAESTAVHRLSGNFCLCSAS